MKDKVILTFFNKGSEVEQFTVTHNTEHCSCGKLSWVIRFEEKTFMVRFANEKCRLTVVLFLSVACEICEYDSNFESSVIHDTISRCAV